MSTQKTKNKTRKKKLCLFIWGYIIYMSQYIFQKHINKHYNTNTKLILNGIYLFFFFFNYSSLCSESTGFNI